jgi:hypothetical protein
LHRGSEALSGVWCPLCADVARKLADYHSPPGSGFDVYKRKALAMKPLFCDLCQTRWTEAVLHPFEKCPFMDCDGTLTRTPPERVHPRPPVRRERPTFPLLEIAERESELESSELDPVETAGAR